MVDYVEMKKFQSEFSGFWSKICLKNNQDMYWDCNLICVIYIKVSLFIQDIQLNVKYFENKAKSQSVNGGKVSQKRQLS